MRDGEEKVLTAVKMFYNRNNAEPAGRQQPELDSETSK
jgi:hypothetical protein